MKKVDLGREDLALAVWVQWLAANDALDLLPALSPDQVKSLEKTLGRKISPRSASGNPRG